jgi:predicted helicase
VTTFYDILEQYRTVALDEHDKGKRFENLVRRFMLTEPMFVQRFQKVIAFADWAASAIQWRLARIVRKRHSKNCSVDLA